MANLLIFDPSYPQGLVDPFNKSIFVTAIVQAVLNRQRQNVGFSLISEVKHNGRIRVLASIPKTARGIVTAITPNNCSDSKRTCKVSNVFLVEIS